MKPDILYIFGGEKAQGAEIVIERLMHYNSVNVNIHLIASPGTFTNRLIAAQKPYKITQLKYLKKLNRSATRSFYFYLKALINYFAVSLIVYRYIKKYNINIIHANTIVPASYLLPLIIYSRLFSPKKIWVWSDHDMKYFSRLENVLANYCRRFYTNTLAVSEAVKNKYADKRKVLVLYNGLDIDVFKPDADAKIAFRKKLNLDVDSKILGIAANICPGKGQLQLIDAFNELSAYNPNVILLIAGAYAPDDMQYNNAVKAAIMQNKQILYLGHTDNIIEFYNGCDIIISNSDRTRSESLGTTIYEAMACQKIVVASFTGGTPEIITDNVDGFLFECENLQDLKKTLHRVVNEFKDTDTIKLAAREKVKAKFNIYNMINNYNKIIMDNISAKPNILYVFGGEKAQGAEIVIERLMSYNADNVNTHLFIAPGKFANDLLNKKKPYTIKVINNLKKLNRNTTGTLKYYVEAIKNYITIPYIVYRYIRKNNIDIIHSNTIVPASYLIPLILFSRVFLRSKKWIWSDHDLQYFSDIEHTLSNVCSKLYDHTLVVSQAVKNKYKHNDRVVVLYNGLDTEIFKPDELARHNFRKKHNIDSSYLLFGMAAVISPIKGQLELIQAFVNLTKTYSNIRLYFAGGYADDDPEYFSKVVTAIEKNPNIHHLGYIDDMMDFYNGCDVIISNSVQEPLGTNIYEAMACEKILLASNSGGTPEIISDKKDGFLFITKNKEDLLEKLRNIIENHSRLNEIKFSARNKVKQHFNILGMMKNYNKLVQNHIDLQVS